MCGCTHPANKSTHNTKIIPLKRRRKELHLHGVFFVVVCESVGYSTHSLSLAHSVTPLSGLCEPCIFVFIRLCCRFSHSHRLPSSLFRFNFFPPGSVTCLNWRFNHIPFFLHSTFIVAEIERVIETERNGTEEKIVGMVSEIYSYQKSVCVCVCVILALRCSAASNTALCVIYPNSHIGIYCVTAVFRWCCVWVWTRVRGGFKFSKSNTLLKFVTNKITKRIGFGHLFDFRFYSLVHSLAYTRVRPSVYYFGFQFL